MSTPRIFAFDFDSTLVGVESLEELIALSLAEQSRDHADSAMKEIRRITDAGMNGEIDLSESFRRRMELARIHRRHLDQFILTATDRITTGMPELIALICSYGHHIYIVSGGIIQCIVPVAETLGIPEDRIFTNKAEFDREGWMTSDGFGPMATNFGKIDVLRSLKQKTGAHITMIGDGMSDYLPYANGACDSFIGFGIHSVHQEVRKKAPYYFTHIEDVTSHIYSKLNS